MKQKIAVLLLCGTLSFLVSCEGDLPKDTIIYTMPSATTVTATTSNTSFNDVLTESTTITDVSSTSQTTTSVKNSHIDQTFSFKEEFDTKHHAVKITVISNKKVFVKYLRDETESIIMLEGEYIENYKYFSDRLDDGKLGIGSDYMESPLVIYIPVSKYESLKGTTLYIQGENYRDTNGKMNTASAAYTLNFDYESCYSREPLLMENEFLHKALTAYFNGEYSHHDLLDIEFLYIDYKNFDMESRIYLPPVITIGYSNGGEWITRSYNYSDFFDDIIENPSLMPSELLEDLSYFPAIQSVLLRDMDGDEKFDEIEKTLLPYKVTEDTWSDESQ